SSAAQISSSVASGLPYLRLLATVPLKRYGFWGTSPIRDHRMVGSRSRTSTPSMSTAPEVTSKRRATKLIRLVLPEPVLPMMAVVSPASDVNEMSSSTGCSAPGYRNPTPRNSSRPWDESSATGASGGMTEGGVPSTS